MLPWAPVFVTVTGTIAGVLYKIRGTTKALSHFQVMTGQVSFHAQVCASNGLTLMLLLSSLANIKWCKHAENDRNPGTWVLIREYSVGAIQWIPIWQGLDLHPCALDESSLSICVNPFTPRVPLENIHLWIFDISKSQIQKACICKNKARANPFIFDIQNAF